MTTFSKINESKLVCCHLSEGGMTKAKQGSRLQNINDQLNVIDLKCTALNRVNERWLFC